MGQILSFGLNLFGSSSNCAFEVYFSKKQAITRIGFRPGFAPKAMNWGKSHEIQPVHSTCRTAFVATRASTSPTRHPARPPTGGFPSLRHNEIRDVTADLIRQVAHSVSVEPPLQPLSGEQFSLRSASLEDNARLDIAASVSGLRGGRFERTMFDIRVFNPYAASNRAASTPAVYARHEREKRRRYEERTREVERASFVPVVMSASGGAGKAATVLYKRLAALISEKRNDQYSATMAWIRTRLCFTLVRSSIMCLRGARSSKSRYLQRDPFAVVAAEARLRPEASA